jgi:AraC family transcriptional regulator, transcriptional activator of pobA
MYHLTHEDRFLLSEFRKALRLNATEDIVNLDDSFTHKFNFQVHRIEDVLTDTNRTIPPNRWSYHRIGFLKQGACEFITGIHKFRAAKNTLVVIPARVTTSSKNWTPDTEAYVALFNIDFFLQNNFPRQYIESKKILNASIKPYIHLTDKQGAEIAGIFEIILKEKMAGNKNKDELIALKIIELLIISERFFEEEQHFEDTGPTTDLVKNFIDLLDANYLKEHSVRFYAGQLAIHPNYLNSLIKKHTGLTAKESIRNRLLLETKYLLHSTSLSIKEISNLMGFNDPNYFTVFFKQLENVSPVNYRSAYV